MLYPKTLNCLQKENLNSSTAQRILLVRLNFGFQILQNGWLQVPHCNLWPKKNKINKDPPFFVRININ